MNSKQLARKALKIRKKKPTKIQIAIKNALMMASEIVLTTIILKKINENLNFYNDPINRID